MVVYSDTLVVAAAAMRTRCFDYWHGPYTWVTDTAKTKSHGKTKKGLKKIGEVLYDKI